MVWIHSLVTKGTCYTFTNSIGGPTTRRINCACPSLTWLWLLVDSHKGASKCSSDGVSCQEWSRRTVDLVHLKWICLSVDLACLLPLFPEIPSRMKHWAIYPLPSTLQSLCIFCNKRDILANCCSPFRLEVHQRVHQFLIIETSKHRT
jgi:hypothetical protein